MKLAIQSAFDKTRDILNNVGGQTGFGNLKDDTQLNAYGRMALLANIALGLVGIVATIYLIHAGIKWVRAGGNEQDIKDAKEQIRSALIGLVVVFGSYVIVNYVINRLIGAVT